MCGAHRIPGTSELLIRGKFAWKKSKESSEKMKRRRMASPQTSLKEIIYRMKQFTVLFLKKKILLH